MLDGDIYGLIAPYATANLWWWPYMRKFHHRYDLTQYLSIAHPISSCKLTSTQVL